MKPLFAISSSSNTSFNSHYNDNSDDNRSSVKSSGFFGLDYTSPIQITNKPQLKLQRIFLFIFEKIGTVYLISN
jgi:hypothetical protein